MRGTICAALALLALAGCSGGDEPKTSPPTALLPEHRRFATTEQAFRAVLTDNHRVIGVGEYHVTTGGPEVTSALVRFRDELLPVLQGRATDLVVETWAEYGNCDAQAAAASATVKRDIERPLEIENEVVSLLRRAEALKVRPHVLPFSCDDYRSLLGADGQVDYEKLLLLITARLRAEALAGLAQPDAVIAVFGGATHNDLYPYEAVADLSYAPAIVDQAPGAYVEIDLYVPELVRGDRLLASEPWYPLLELPGGVGPDRALLIERGTDSYIILLPTSASPSPARAAD